MDALSDMQMFYKIKYHCVISCDNSRNIDNQLSDLVNQLNKKLRSIKVYLKTIVRYSNQSY